MGRKQKYQTDDERKEAQRRWSREYYHRNKNTINRKAMEKYYELREDSRCDNQSSEE